MLEGTNMSDKSSRSAELPGGIRQRRPSQAPKKIEGSVFEFAFGPRLGSYFATSYPYHIAPAFAKQPRIRHSRNLPTDLEEFLDKPKFIQNVAINKDEQWFVYYTPITMRISQRTSFGLESAPKTSTWRESMNFLKGRHQGLISTVTFAENYEDCFFMRLTLDDSERWKMTIGPKVPFHCLRILMSEIDRPVRACTFGHNESWIVYGRNWNEHGGKLPEGLASLLDQGKNRNINKVVLNPYTPDEYVLVFDDGEAHGRFHRDFRGQFLEVYHEWRREKIAVAPNSIRDDTGPNIDYYPPQIEDIDGEQSDLNTQLNHRTAELVLAQTDNISPQVTKSTQNHSVMTEEKIAHVRTQQSTYQQGLVKQQSPPSTRGQQQQNQGGDRETNPSNKAEAGDVYGGDRRRPQKRGLRSKTKAAIDKFLSDKESSQRPEVTYSES